MMAVEQQALWDAFLARWPREHLEALSLEQYVSVNDTDTFTYWLETKTRPLGSIQGNTSAKFGIYRRNGKGKTQSGIAHGDVYTWRTRYGLNEAEVFSYVKKTLMAIADAAYRGDLNAIDELDFAPLVKWKIAFLYQNPNAPVLINTFSKPMLEVLTGAEKKTTFPQLYAALIQNKGEKRLLEYGKECWHTAAKKHNEIMHKVVLSHFSHVDAFQRNVANWDAQMVASFCDIILEARKQKLDVFTTAQTSGEMIRIGRKELNAIRADEVFATFEPTGAKLKYSQRYLYREQYFTSDINPELVNSIKISKDLKAFNAEYAIERKPYWPENYFDEFYEDDTISVDVIVQEDVMQTPSPLNQILYGPPGTGKTYHTIEAAVKAAEPTFTWQSRVELKAEYERLMAEKRIRFVTFHQSYGYEEFVEGLHAQTDEDGQVCYGIKQGIFKQICESAQPKKVASRAGSSIAVENRKIWKMSLGNTQTSEGGTIYPECLENNYILLGYGEDIDFSQCHNASLVKQRFIEAGYEIKPQDYNVTSVNTFVNKMREGDLVVISDGNHRFKAIAEVTSGYSVLEGDCDRDGYLQKREVRWLLTFDTPRPVDELCHTVFSQMTLYNLKDSVISREKLSALLNQKEETLEEVLNHVLVIDEINRGNISKIFGELITLIEPSKRQGADEALALTLPHSQQPFSVPDNLFIIGTMNTADRSLAMMDTALRRRFEFVEMMPQPALLAGCVVNGIDVQRLLKTMNDRIEILYDREHTLGHAFFMPVKALMDDDKPERAFAALISVFQNKIIPLLEEYFFEDWNKIRLVLADNQKPKGLQFITQHTLQTAELNTLFGAGHGLDQYGQSVTSYQLSPNQAAVWQSSLAYTGIYETAGDAALSDDERQSEKTDANWQVSLSGV